MARLPTVAAMARKHRLKRVYVPFGIFDYGVTIVIGAIEDAIKFANWAHEDPNRTGGPARALTFSRKGYEPIIWLPRAPRTAREHGTLAHEALHAIVCLSRWADFALDEHSEETFCHGVGHVVTKALEQLRG